MSTTTVPSTRRDRGSIHPRNDRGPGFWRISAEVDPDPATGRRRRVHRTIRGTYEDAERALAALLAAPPAPTTITSHHGARVELDEGVAHAQADHRTNRRRPLAHPAPPAAVTLRQLPAALVTHDCSTLCRGDVHAVTVVVERNRAGSDIDAAAALGGVRAGVVRLARPCERREIPRPGFEVRVVAWGADR